MALAGRAQPRRMGTRRVLAGVAVAACIMADVWSVALAANEPGATGSVAAGAGDAAQAALRTSNDEGQTGGTRPEPPDAAHPVVEKGNGRLKPVAIPVGALKSAAKGRVVRISVETEGGLPADPTEFAATVATVLSDPRGWQRTDHVRFVAVPPAAVAKGARVDLRIALVSPDLTDRLCAPLQTRGQVSCHNRHRAVINLRRWQLGVKAYGSDLPAYRTYVINHEVGHGLGHSHAYCGGPDEVAPLMMQQTYGLGGCTAWPWPSAKVS